MSAVAQQKQLARARTEVEASIANARSLRDQWLVITRGNPTNLTKKEVDNIGKAFKNRLLTVKWDCEDLEELVSVSEHERVNVQSEEVVAAKLLIEECRDEISHMMNQLEETEANGRLFNKHGITALPSVAQKTVSSMIQSPNSKYERIANNDAEEVQFDIRQVESVSNASIVNNALYDHLEGMENEQLKTFNPSQVFNNLSRPTTNVYMNSNENEIILDMLETEYYNPPAGLQNRSGFNYAIQKLIGPDRNRFLGAVAFIFSFPILLVLFMIV